MDENSTLPPQGSDASQQGDQNNQSMESLLANENLNVDMPQAGEIRTGTIASIAASQVLVSIGAKSEGIISGRELDQLSPEEHEMLKVGAEVPVYVVNPEDENGNVVLSFRRAQEQISWENVEKMLEDDRVYDSKIVGFNKGGLIVMVGGCAASCLLPRSAPCAGHRLRATHQNSAGKRWLASRSRCASSK